MSIVPVLPLDLLNGLSEKASATTNVTTIPPNDNNGPQILAVNGTFLGLALLTVLGRLYVRLVMLKTVGVDDYFIVLAMGLGIATYVCLNGEVQNGMGRHYEYLTLDDLIGIFHWQFFHAIFIVTGVSIIKVSIGFFLLRLVPHKNYRKFIIGTIIFVFAFTISSACTLIFYCSPISASWDLRMLPSQKHCYSAQTYTDIGLFNSSLNILTDVIFAILPIPVVMKLQINVRTKVTLILILSLGLVACVAAVIKTVYQSRLIYTPDYYFTDTFMTWNIIEFSLGVLACSLPSLKPLFASFLESTRALTGSGSRSKSKGTAITSNKFSTFNKNSQGFRKSGYVMQRSDHDMELGRLDRHEDSYDVQITSGPQGRRLSKVGFDITTKSMESMKTGDRDVAGDNSSEEGILAMQGTSRERQQPSSSKGQILKTTEVRIH